MMHPDLFLPEIPELPLSVGLFSPAMLNCVEGSASISTLMFLSKPIMPYVFHWSFVPHDDGFSQFGVSMDCPKKCYEDFKSYGGKLL